MNTFQKQKRQNIKYKQPELPTFMGFLKHKHRLSASCYSLMTRAGQSLPLSPASLLSYPGHPEPWFCHNRWAFSCSPQLIPERCLSPSRNGESRRTANERQGGAEFAGLGRGMWFSKASRSDCNFCLNIPR